MNELHEEWFRQIQVMSDDELIRRLTPDPAQAQPEYPAFIRAELERRGFRFQGQGESFIIIAPHGVHLPSVKEKVQRGEMIDPRLKGVGGWLALFIIGQLVCRPLATWGNMVGPNNTDTARIAVRFPATATIINIEKAVMVLLILFGIVIAAALWKVHTPVSVRLTKIFLITIPVSTFFLTLLYNYTDVPEKIRDSIISQGIIDAVASTIVCAIWFLYFTKSKRVRATYFAESNNDDEDITTLGLT